MSEAVVEPINPPPKGKRNSSRGVIRNIGFVALFAGILYALFFVVTNPFFQDIPEAAPKPTRVPFEQPSVAPTPLPDVVIAASAPTGFEFPSVGLKSDNVVLPAGQKDAIEKWTKQDNIKNNGVLRPSGPYDSSMVWDSNVTGGGLVGTDVASSAVIAGHTTSYNNTKLGVFQPLMDVEIGDPAVVINANGRLCYTIVDIDDSIVKNVRVDSNGDDRITTDDWTELDAKYRYGEPVPDVMYFITCLRLDEDYDGPTTNNRVLILELNKAATNAGSC